MKAIMKFNFKGYDKMQLCLRQFSVMKRQLKEPREEFAFAFET
jgi:hypothetical protein